MSAIFLVRCGMGDSRARHARHAEVRNTALKVYSSPAIIACQRKSIGSDERALIFRIKKLKEYLFAMQFVRKRDTNLVSHLFLFTLKLFRKRQSTIRAPFSRGK